MWQNWLAKLQKYRLIAVIRSPSWQLGERMAIAMAEAGVKLIEITWNSDQPNRLVSRLREQLPECDIGAGTITDAKQLTLALDSGVQFIFTPHFEPSLLTIAHQGQIPLIPGAMSPTEIVKAFQAGAIAVKVFPIRPLGGIEYLRCLQAPLSQIPLIPTGGIKLDQTLAFIQAGATAVGLSNDLFPPDLVEKQHWQIISERVAAVQQQLLNN